MGIPHLILLLCATVLLVNANTLTIILVDNDQELMLQQQSNEEHEQSQQHRIPVIGLSIVFIFGGLLYGSLLKVFSRITHVQRQDIQIPYNPMLLLSGLALGIFHSQLGIVGEATKLISMANPNGILAMFLPCLIFESAFKTEWHVFKKLAGQSLILGILSSVVCAASIMLLIKFLLKGGGVLFTIPQIYSWQQAMLFGSILTCTDIFSFVSRLKRSGTPQRITSLIEGESLFNYCTCVLIFQIFEYQGSLKEQASLLSYAQLMMEQIVGGVLFGVIFGFISVYCIKRMIYDGIQVVTLMVIFCYAIYLIAEFSFLRVSGIISVVVYALQMNAFGKTWLFGETLDYVSGFWTYMVFFAETSIFLIAGVLVGANVLYLEEFTQSKELTFSKEIYVALQIYIFAMVSRFCSIAVFIRYLRRMAEGLSWKQTIVLTFAGLKGAIGISLAMLVFKNQHYNVQISSLVLLHATGNSLITLIFNGMATGLIVRMLGVSTLKKIEYKLFQEYLCRLQELVLKRKEQLRANTDDSSYKMVDWKQVDNQVGIESYRKMRQSIDERLNRHSFIQDNKYQKRLLYKLQLVLREYRKQDRPETDYHDESTRFSLQVEFRKRFLKEIIACYWQFHNRNYTTPAALMLLIQSANFDLDKETEELESWYWIKGQITFNMRVFSQFMRLALLNSLAKTHLFEYVSFCYDVVSSYIEANEQVRATMLKGHIVHDQTPILMSVLRESEENQKEAELFMRNYLQPSFPEIQREVKTRKVSFYVLHGFKRIIDYNNENGQLQPNEFDMLNSIIDRKSLALNLYEPNWQTTDFFEIIKKDLIFGILPEPVLKMLVCKQGEMLNFDANELIIDNGQNSKYVYFVKKGSCVVQFTNDSTAYKHTMLMGEVFGFEALVTSDYHSRATASTVAEIIQIKKQCLLKVLQTFTEIQDAFWKSRIFHCYKMFVRKEDISNRIGHLFEDEMHDLIRNFTLQRFEAGDHEVTKDMIYLRGDVEIIDSGVAQNVYPFIFLSSEEDITLRVRKYSYLLVGKLDHEIFDRAALRQSKASKIRRKNISS